MGTRIDTRTELINALHEAAELEHGLLGQYLFAAFSLSHEAMRLPRQAELVREWKGNLLWVAVEEMAHLGVVNNLLSAIGAAPHFVRPPFPQPARYFPDPGDGPSQFLTFSLDRFSTATGETPTLMTPRKTTLLSAAEIESCLPTSFRRECECGCSLINSEKMGREQ